MPYDVPMDAMIPVFAREGSILPMQPNASTTAESRRGAFTVAVYGRQARGDLFWDDGEHVDNLAAGAFYHCFFDFRGGVMRVMVDSPQTVWMEKPVVERLVFHGVEMPTSVTVDGRKLPDKQVNFANGVLTLTVSLHMKKDHVVKLNEK